MFQINAEWCNVVSAFFFESNRNVSLYIHLFSRMDLFSAYNGLIHIVDGRVNIDTVDFYNNIFDQEESGAISCKRWWSAESRRHDRNTNHCNKWNSSKESISDAAGDDRIEMEGIRQFSGLNINFIPDVNTNPSNGKPKLIKFNDIVYYQEFVSPNGTKWKATISNSGFVTYTKVR